MSRGVVLAFALLAAPLGFGPVAAVAAAGPSAPIRLPIRAAIAAPAGRPVVERAFLDRMVARADRIFAPAGVAFELLDVRPVDGGYARLETRADRHALARELAPGAINVFVVASLRDVDDPSRLRQGVHWRPDRARPRVHYVIVSAEAGPDVLAHELGHFFGNHRHSETPGNVMSYVRAGEPFFDEGQLRVIARHVARFLRSGELEARPGGGRVDARGGPRDRARPPVGSGPPTR